MPYGSTRVNKVLTNLSIQYKNSEYIAGKVLKDVNVKKESDIYYVYNSEFRLPETLRANGTPANMSEWAVSTSTYIVNEHAQKDKVTDRDRENADAPLMIDRDTTEYLTDKILLRTEYEVQKLLFTTTTFGNNATLNTATSWVDNTTTSAPIQNVLSATAKIIASAGKKPNTVVMNFDVFAGLKENANVYGRIQYVEKAIITEDLLASLFDVKDVHVGTAIYDQAREGATSSQTGVWPADALVAYFDPSPGIKKVSAAVNFRNTKYGTPWRVKKWREEELEADMIEVQTMFAPKAVATSCGYLFKTAALI